MRKLAEVDPVRVPRKELWIRYQQVVVPRLGAEIGQINFGGGMLSV
jgi:hypothetical protein